MDTQEFKLSEQTREYMRSVTKQSFLLKDAMESKIKHIKDENNNINVSVNGEQKILSLEIADTLLDSPDIKEVSEKLRNIINQVIQISSSNSMNELKSYVSVSEQEDAFSHEPPGVLDNIEILRNYINQLFGELRLMRKNINSKSGNIKLVISGAKLILSLEINREFLSSKNKNILEEELIACVNTAIQEVDNEIIKSIKKGEDEFYGHVARG